MNPPPLSARAAQLGPSPTLAVSAKARSMQAQGIDVVGLSAGEPDFATPESIRRAAIAAIESGFTRYTTTSGIPDLKDAIVAKLARDNNFEVKAEQVVVSCGAKHSVYNAMTALVNPGDEVLILTPFWMTYADQVGLCGGKAVLLPTNERDHFQPDIQKVQAAITDRTKVLMLNSPNNPTGSVLPRRTMELLMDLAIQHNLWVISDEIYEKLIYEGGHISPASLSPEAAGRTITINGCSKTFAMTGWRIGYAAAPLHVAKAMSNIQDQVTSNPTSFAQKGAVTALSLPDQDVEAMREEFRARRDLLIGLLRALPGVHVEQPHGAFYVFADFSAHVGGMVPTDIELADYLLDVAHVATVPGSVFNGPGHLRLSYAASRADIEKGVRRIGEALTQLER